MAWALKSLGRIEVVDAEPTDGPDADLKLRDEFSAELQALVERGGTTRSLQEVAQRLGLFW